MVMMMMMMMMTVNYPPGGRGVGGVLQGEGDPGDAGEHGEQRHHAHRQVEVPGHGPRAAGEGGKGSAGIARGGVTWARYRQCTFHVKLFSKISL